jgi:PAS domain S-box-containing protein
VSKPLFNPAAERILGCPAAQAIGEPAARFATPEGAASREQIIAQLARDPKRVFFYGEDAGILAKRLDGSLFLHEGSLSRSEASGRVFYTVIFRDVEERRGASRDLAKLRRQNAAPASGASVVSSWPTVARSSSTKSARFPRTCR